MQQHRAEAGEETGAVEGSWRQLALELVVFAGIAVLLCLTAARIPDGCPDANAVLGIAVLLHAAGLVRLAVRAADFAERDPIE